MMVDRFPGPTIEARSGDTLEIEVINLLDEGVSLHWHGLHMRGIYTIISCRLECLRLTDANRRKSYGRPGRHYPVLYCARGEIYISSSNW